MPEVAIEPQQAALASQAEPHAPDPALERALDQLLLSNQIRELADLAQPVMVAQLPPLRGFVARIVRRVYGAGKPLARFTPSAGSVLRHVALDACVLVWLRAWLARGRIWRMARTTFGALLRNCVGYQTRYHAQPSSGMTGYVGSELEAPLIRACLLLRTMRRYGACIEFFLRRLRSGLPAERTRQWLAFFLKEIGDAEPAARLTAPDPHRNGAPAGGTERAAGTGMPAARRTSRLRYGVVMPIMQDTPVFRRSLLSLLDSDVQGQVVVVEDGYRPERSCEAFCAPLPVTYVKNPRWVGPDAVVNLGIRQLRPDTDIVIYAHADICWPPAWFGHLDEAWDAVHDTGKVGMINLGYLQFHPRSDQALTELFLQGPYADLAWLLRAMRECPPPREGRIQSIQIEDMSRRFGLARDAWMDRPAELRQMVGKYSVAASFPMQSWRDLGGFDEAAGHSQDVELQYYGVQRRTWSLWINNPPLIHLVGADTARLAGAEKAASAQRVRATYDAFAKRHGWGIDHFLWTCFADVYVTHHDEIVAAANAGRFADLDHLFDKIQGRMKRTTLSTCEFPWCGSRAACPYVEPPEVQNGR